MRTKTRSSRGWIAPIAVAFILAVVVASAAPSAFADDARSSAIAKLCQHGGFTSLFQPNGTPFASAGTCMRYGLRGGQYSSLRLEQRACPAGFPADDVCLFVTGFGLEPLSFAAPSEISFVGDAQLDQFNGPTVGADGTVDQLFAAFSPCSAFVTATARAYTSLGVVIKATTSKIACS